MEQLNISKQLKKAITRDVLIKQAVSSVKEKRGSAYLKIKILKDELELNRLLNSDNVSELELILNSLEETK